MSSNNPVEQGIILGPFSMFKMMLGSFLSVEEASACFKRVPDSCCKSPFLESVLGFALVKVRDLMTTFT